MIIPIVYSTDDNVADLCSVSISSIFNNSCRKNIYKIYVFYSRLSKKHINNLESMSKLNIKVKCIDVSKYINYDDLYEVERYPYEIFFRLYIPFILDYDKVIYLDCDTIVLDDISLLYKEKINTSLGCVADYCFYTGGDYYFNSGVLLFNSKIYRKNKILDKCINLLKEDKSFKFPDQDILNIICCDDHTELHPKYNYQIHELYVSRFRCLIDFKYRDLFNFSPVVVHYSYLTKPHKTILSSYNKYFWMYAKDTKYYNQLVDKYLDDPFKVVYNSFLEEMYLNSVYDGKIGLKGIFNTFFKSLKYWFLYKRRGGKNEFKKKN
ncbi:MAG: glycosyltransferase family 8 protein [Bacilli bacterium]|nr:glycosyltransferase family 8 protein [Bacilli bacterium]